MKRMIQKMKNPALPSASPSGDAWWRGAVIYQIYPRSFQDSNGDGIGDLPGITARLDHVASLGVDAIWISPFFRSPMKDFGYDVSDYRDVDPIFGTLADFDALLARAHQLGLRVMIDQVLSHTSDQHAWFQESRLSRDNPKSDWYVWADARPDGTPPNNWLSVFGGSAWQWDSRRRQYYLHSFLSSQPDLNFHNPAVQDALLGEVRFWCEKGVDGFRFDACNHQFHDAQLRDNPPAQGGEVSTVRADNPYAMQQHLHDKSRPENLAFLERLRGVLDAFGAASIGEVGDENAPPLMADYTEAGRRLHMAYSFSLLTAHCAPSHLRAEVEKLEREIARTGGWGCWAFSNHDVPRVASRWSSDGQPDDRRFVDRRRRGRSGRGRHRAGAHRRPAQGAAGVKRLAQPVAIEGDGGEGAAVVDGRHEVGECVIGVAVAVVILVARVGIGVDGVGDDAGGAPVEGNEQVGAHRRAGVRVEHAGAAGGPVTGL